METINILAIPGSLRQASLTGQLMRSLQPIAPADVQISIFYLNDVPPYNQDVENNHGFPAAVQEMRDQIEAADGLIFATPEYNGGMSGVLKNGIDWASRGGILANKPVAPISGSPGALGATKAQEGLRSVLNHLGMHVLSRPAVAIPQMHEKLANDTITDEMTLKFVTDWLSTFRNWIVQLNK
ncbi:MAG: NAD(P)H-dependent oxidoreductase [Caldilineaceae bacterium]